MYKTIYAVTFLLNVVLICRSSSGKSVQELNQDTFSQIIDGTKFAFVFFYAPWHGHCKKILKTFEQVGDAFTDRADVTVAKVNAYKETKLATRYWVDDYPQFRFFVKGSTTEEMYEGGHQPDDFIRFIQAKSNIILNTELFKTPVIDLDKFNFERIVKDRARHVMVHYYNGFCKLCEEFELTSYRTVGTTFRNEPNCVLARLDCDNSPGICVQQQIPHYPTLKVYPRGNKDGFIYEPGKLQESYSETNLTRFLNALCGTQRTTRGRLHEKVSVTFCLFVALCLFMACISVCCLLRKRYRHICIVIGIISAGVLAPILAEEFFLGLLDSVSS